MFARGVVRCVTGCAKLALAELAAGSAVARKRGRVVARAPRQRRGRTDGFDLSIMHTREDVADCVLRAIARNRLRARRIVAMLCCEVCC